MSKINKPFATLNDINALVLVADANGDILFANKAIEEILGYSQQEVLGNGWWELTGNEQDINNRKSVVAAMANGTTALLSRHLYESAIPTKDGRTVWTQWTNKVTPEKLVIGIAQDISEKKILQDKLIRKNKENELLLKEIHHRVKNNLQIITSLLNLQFNSINDKRVIDALLKTKNRINSMALIHTKLYQSDNLSSMNFEEYMKDITHYISKSYNTQNIKHTIKHSGAAFNIDLSINLGLIITELLTNSYKHAFNEKKKGAIKIEVITNSNNKHKLIIEDNGTGIRESVDGKQSQSLGLEIVKDLVDQINGTIETISNKGVKYLIAFEH